MDAHLNLGIAYQELNERALATRYLRRAIELDANSAEAHNALAWLLATAPDRTPASTAEAVTLAQRAAALTAGRDASALDTLAAAFAAAGDRGRAAAAAERALEVATASRQTALAHAIQRRLEMYRRQ
jgi:Tfp pilus assembly protein PilF